jgi:hypothetical protein
MFVLNPFPVAISGTDQAFIASISAGPNMSFPVVFSRMAASERIPYRQVISMLSKPHSSAVK